MHDYQLKEMADVLVSERVIDEKEKDLAILALKKYWCDKIALTWSVDDVLEQAKNDDIVLSMEDAECVLNTIFHHHDCEYGISWDTIRDAISFYHDECEKEPAQSV